MVSVCRGSIHTRRSSGEESSSFFEKVQLHFELANLFVQFVLLGLDLLLLPFVALAEHLRQAGQSLFLPTADLRRMDTERLRDLRRRLVSP